MGKKVEPKTTYSYNEDECRILDGLLKKVYESSKLYSLNKNNYNLCEKDILILTQAGFVEMVSINENELLFKITPEGSTHYRNGGFAGERKRNIQVSEDRIIDIKLKKQAIIASLFSGGAAGAIISILWQIFFS